MRASRKQRRSKKKTKWGLGASLSAILLISIIGVVAYKNYPSIEKQIAAWTSTSPTEGKEQSSTMEKNSAANAEPTPTEEKPQDEPTEQQGEQASEQPVEQLPVVGPSGYIEGQQDPIEPTYINGVLLVNKKYPLPSTYNSGEDPTARAAYEQMAVAALQSGYELVAFSGFRSYEYQTTLYQNYVNRDGQENADRYSARPGYSEHQTGLAFDIGEKGREDLWLTAEFGETPAGQWLLNNAHLYGFILRYPQGKENITGFMYESWHFRYLGVEIATKVYESGLTLEEYLQVQ